MNELTKAGIALLSNDELFTLKTRLLEDMSTEPDRGRYNYLRDILYEVGTEIQRRQEV